MGRGALVPGVLLPVVLVLLAGGCTLVLAGALRVTWPLRVLVLVVYLSFAVSVRQTADRLGLLGDWRRPVSWAAIGAVVAVFAYAVRGRPRPAMELLVLAAGCTATLAVAQEELLRSEQFSDGTLLLGTVELLLSDVRDLTVPLVVAAGAGAVGFGVAASRWALHAADRRLPRRAVIGALAAVLVWRAWSSVQALTDVGVRVGPLLGALGVAAVVVAVAVAVDRLAPAAALGTEADDDELEVGHVAGRLGLPLAAVAAVPIIVSFVVALVVVTILRVTGEPIEGVFQFDLRATDFLGNDRLLSLVRIGLGLGATALGLAIARRGHRVVGLYIAVVGAVDLNSHVTRRGGRPPRSRGPTSTSTSSRSRSSGA